MGLEIVRVYQKREKSNCLHEHLEKMRGSYFASTSLYCCNNLSMFSAIIVFAASFGSIPFITTIWFLSSSADILAKSGCLSFMFLLKVSTSITADKLPFVASADILPFVAFPWAWTMFTGLITAAVASSKAAVITNIDDFVIFEVIIFKFRIL